MVTWDDRNFQRALKQYLALRGNVDPAREIKRRAKNVGMRLVRIYKEEGAKAPAIASKVKSLGFKVKVRSKLKGTRKEKIAKELRARKSAIGFTATGWFPAVISLGGNPRDSKTRTGPRRGKLIEKISGSEKSETLVNQQPGAGHVATKSADAMQRALDQETEDMVKYISKKLEESARRNGL